MPKVDHAACMKFRSPPAHVFNHLCIRGRCRRIAATVLMLMNDRRSLRDMVLRRTGGRFIDALDRVDVADIRLHILLPGRNVVSAEILLRHDILELLPYAPVHHHEDLQ